jgi:hypothetical protein
MGLASRAIAARMYKKGEAFSALDTKSDDKKLEYSKSH